MGEATLELVEQAMSSPWVYLALLVVSALDGFLPLVPSETSVITAAVFAAANGEPHLAGVIAAAAAGAFLGDHVSYFIGRFAGRRLGDRLYGRGRRAAAVRWAARALDRRGGMFIVVARYIPGGRTAVTLATGVVGYPLRRFAFFDAIAAVTWAVYSAMIGYLGGHAFEENPLYGLVLGLGVAFALSLAVEVVTRLRRRRRSAAARPAAQPPAARRTQHEPERSRPDGVPPIR